MLSNSDRITLTAYEVRISILFQTGKWRHRDATHQAPIATQREDLGSVPTQSPPGCGALKPSAIIKLILPDRHLGTDSVLPAPCTPEHTQCTAVAQTHASPLSERSPPMDGVRYLAAHHPASPALQKRGADAHEFVTVSNFRLSFASQTIL